MREGATPNLPNNGVRGNLVAKHLAAAFADLQQPRDSKQFKELANDNGDVISRHRRPWNNPVGLAFQELSEGTPRPDKGHAISMYVVTVFTLSRIGEGRPVHLLILVDGPRLLEPLVASLLELILIVGAQVVNLDGQFAAKDIQQRPTPLHTVG